MRISVVLGTRPEIIKMAPVVRELDRLGADYFVLHTGQHYSYALDRVFFQQLHLPHARHNLEVGSGAHGAQTAKIIAGAEKVLEQEKPDVILVEGDTNTVLGCAIAATKMHILVGHIEAGLRSYDRRMPEEVNRILTDHCSDYLFAPSEKSRQTLLSEGIPDEKVFVTGNTIVDAVMQNVDIARGSSGILARLGLRPRQYFLATVHRQENVDDRTRFQSILTGLGQLAREFELPIIYPVHPRSAARMKEFGLVPTGVTMIEPVSFLDFLQLESNACLVLTDSGGVQEETCILGVPCVTLRDNTERPETIEVGANVLAGVEAESIISCSRRMLARTGAWPNPFGDGKAAEKIINIILEGTRGQGYGDRGTGCGGEAVTSGT